MTDRHAAFVRRAAITALMLTAAWPALAAAQSGPVAAPAKPAAAPVRPTAVDPYDTEDEVSAVVVTANRPQPGAVIGDIKPEIQLTPQDIQSYGVSTLTELLDELAPQTRSDRGRSNDGPVVLLNGRRISGFQEIRDIPVEAIQRIDILPEEVALKYGYTANQRVVNVVLRRFFRAWTGEAGAGASTDGGYLSGSAEADLFHVFRDDRLNLDLKVNANSNLLESDRNIVSSAATLPYDLQGNVFSTIAGGIVDPALSPTATVAGVPAVANNRTLTLGDFASAAGIANATAIGRYRTLTPEKQSVAANAVLAKPLPFGFNGTINGTLEATHSEALQGLPTLGLTVPAGDPFSPFGRDVTLDRYSDAHGPLSQDNTTWSAHLGGGANRDFDKWHLTLTGAYDHAENQTDSDVGLDPTAAQALLTARSATFNPFGPIPEALLVDRARNNANSVSDSGNIQALANGPLFTVPAGQLYGSFKVGDAPTYFSSTSSRLGAVQSIDLQRNTFNAQANFDLPLASKSKDVFGFLGSLSVNGNVAIDQLSDFGTLLTYGEGLNWTPFTGWNVILSHTHDEAAATLQQLGNPTILTVGVPIFDYVTGRTATVTRIDGGNPNLIGDSREVTKLGLTFKPIPTQDLTFQANYVKERIDNPVETFPSATAEIIAAFPDRFVRDTAGNLISVDNRPVNFARSDREELRYGLNYTRPVGPQPKRPEPGQRRQQRDEDAQRQRVTGGGGGFGGPGGGGGFGGGGRGGRGGFGGPPPGPDGGRLQLALYHTVIFNDQLLVRPGGPVLDLLNGSAAGSTGGTPQHEIEAQLGFTMAGFGARVSADYKTGTTVRGASSALGDLNFSGLGTVNLRLFDNFTQQPWALKKFPVLQGSRLTFSVNNLFNERIRVTDALGATPISYQAAYLDPVGRSVRIQFRKLFFTPPSPAEREKMRAAFRAERGGRGFGNDGPAIPPPPPPPGGAPPPGGPPPP